MYVSELVSGFMPPEAGFLIITLFLIFMKNPHTALYSDVLNLYCTNRVGVFLLDDEL